MYFDRRLWNLTRGCRGRIAFTVGLGLGSSLLGLIRLTLLGWLLAQVFAGHSLQMLWWPAVVVVALILLRSAWDHWRFVYCHETAARVQQSIRLRLFEHICRLGPARFSHARTGEVISAAAEGVERLEIYFGKYLPQFFVAFLTPVILFVFIARFSLPVALVLLAAALFTLLAPALYHRLESHHSLKQSTVYREYASEYLDGLQGLAALKALGRSASFGDRLAAKARELSKRSMRVLALNSLSRGITDFGVAVGAAAGLGTAAWQYQSGQIDITVLLIVLMLGVEVFRPLRDLRALLHDGMMAQSAAAQVFSILDDDAVVADAGTATMLETTAMSIRFNGVAFRYPGERRAVYEDLNLRIDAGERVAIVGDSGSGKSTLVHLLQRFYDPRAGRIEIAGIDIRDLGLNTLRRQMAVVSQDTMLFHGSVADNLRLGKPDATEAEMRMAAQAANADEFIQALPRGFDTLIGERGLRLSGGQRQRIAIARAVLRDAPILILDEALSSVDAENEALIQQALDPLMRGRTSIILAHRLSSILGADRILVLQSGTIVEEGSHAMLMAKRGSYFRLMSEQESQRLDLLDDEAPHPLSSERVEEAATREDVEPDDYVLKPGAIGWRTTLSRLMGYVDNWRGRLLLTLGLGIGRVLAFIGVSLLSAIAVISVRQEEEWLPVLGVLVFVAALAGLLHWLESWVAHDMAFRLLADMRVDLYRKIDSLAPAFLLKRRAGDLVNLATHDVELVEYFYAHTVAPGFVAILVPTLVLTLLWQFHWAMALVLLPFLLLVALIPLVWRRHIDEQASASRALLGRLSAHLVENLQGLHEILSYDYTVRRREQLLEVLGAHQSIRKQFYRDLSRQGAVSEAAAGIGGAAVIVVGALLVQSGRLDPDYLPFLTLAAMAAFLPVSEIADVGRQLADTLGATRRLICVEEEPPAVVDAPCRILPAAGGGSTVAFSRVGFCYDEGNRRAIDELDFEIEAGRAVALVGPSGAGKTTVAQLLLRFWDPDQGVIRIDGIDIREVAVDDLRRRIALVAQDTWLFNRTIRENLLLARPEASEADLARVLDQAEMSGFVSDLPEGLETRVGERGYALSGGQRQRLSIARAFLKDAPVLVLDEATSQLDAVSERAVHRSLSELMRNRTTLVIAHRLSTIRGADRILVLDAGRLVEAGSHQDLLRHRGLYARLVHHQSTAGGTRATS